MNILFEARHMEVTNAMREYVEAKVSKLPRFYDNIRSIEVILDMEADRPVADLAINAFVSRLVRILDGQLSQA